MLLLKIYGCVLVAMGLVTFVAYGWDKRQAKVDGWRTPEAKLHSLALFGGIVGAWFGQKLFRHKTAKSGFLWMTWGITLLHVILFGLLIWLAFA